MWIKSGSRPPRLSPHLPPLPNPTASPPRRVRPQAVHPRGVSFSRPRRSSHVAFGLDGNVPVVAPWRSRRPRRRRGARDATAGEIESNFNAKSLGEADTEHMNKVPDGLEQFTSLELRSCVVLDAGAAPIEERLKLVYQKQVLDWKIRVVPTGTRCSAASSARRTRRRRRR